MQADFDLLIELQNQGKFQLARQECDALLKSHPENDKIWHFSGLLAAQAGDYKLCCQHLQQALSLNPDSHIYHNHYGNALRNLGEIDKATKHYLHAIDIKPDYPEGLNNLANIYYRQQQFDKAMEYYQKAIRILPDYSDAHFNIANIYSQKEQFEEAIIHYQQAIKTNPNNTTAFFNLGMAARAEGHLDIAVAAFWRFIELNPTAVNGHYFLAQSYNELNRNQEAIAQYEKILELDPNNSEAMHNIACIYHKQDQYEPAIEWYKKSLTINPNNQMAQFQLAAITSEQKFTNAPSEYLTSLFGQYARSYDKHLCQQLKYKAPEIVATAVNTFFEPKERLIIVDIGCGTGLLGKLLQPFAYKLIGVDLSVPMLKLAKKLEVYHELINSDMVTYLEQNPHRFDVITAADVLIYIGDLAQIFATAKKALQQKGYFIFTVEKNIINNHNFHLALTGRFCHSKSYIKKLAKEYDFRIKTFEEVVTRTHEGRPVAAFLVVLMG